jgi:hypothetical protein
MAIFLEVSFVLLGLEETIPYQASPGVYIILYSNIYLKKDGKSNKKFMTLI